jgi:hypothetical protein
VIREDRRLLVFPLVSAAANLLIGAVVWGAAFGIVNRSDQYRTVFIVGGIIASFPATFVTLFSGVALATVLARKLDGIPVTSADGWRAARERIGIIGAWTLLVCTVGAILRLLEEYLPIGGKIAVWLLDVSWALATMFAVPVLAYEGLGPRATLTRSAEIFKARWGEQVAGVLLIGFGTAFLVIPAVILIVAGFAAGGAAGIVLLAVGGAALLAVGAYSMALNQVYRVFLYRSAVADPASPSVAAGPFAAEDLASPFRRRRGLWT